MPTPPSYRVMIAYFGDSIKFQFIQTFLDFFFLQSADSSASKHGTPSQRGVSKASAAAAPELAAASSYPSGTYPPRASSGQNSSSAADSVSGGGFVVSGGATLSRLHMLQQGPTPQESIKRQTLSARGLSDKEFTKHCRGFDGQIKVSAPRNLFGGNAWYHVLVPA